MRKRNRTVGSRAEWITLGGLLALALALRIHGLGWGLPGVYEEAYPFKKAWEMWGFGPLRRLDLDPHWFRYPTLTLYLQMLGQALSFGLLRASGAAHSMTDVRFLYLFDKTLFYWVGRSITVLFGAALVLPTWALAKRAGGTRAAVVAALLVAIQPDLIEKSQVIEVDVPLTCLATAALAAAVAMIERPSRRAAWIAGVLAGFAASAKYPGFFLAIPLGIACVLASRNAPATAAPVAASSERGARGEKRREPKPAAARRASAVELALHALTALGLGFVLTSPYVLLDFQAFLRDIGSERVHMAAGHFGLAPGLALFTYACNWFTTLMGWPLGLAALAGLVVFTLRRRPWALLIASFLVPYLAIVGSWQMKADRYLLPLVPLGIVLAATLLDEAARAVAARSPRAPIAITIAGAALFGIPLAMRLPAHWAAVAPDTRTLARRWIQQHVPPGSLVVTEPYGAELFSPLDLQDIDPDLAREIDAGGHRKRLYGLQQMPMFQVQPERSAKYYSVSRMGAADVIVVTDAVQSRYRQDPHRFAAQLAFYDSLAALWPRLASFVPHHQPGPAITVYRNPQATAPFGSRTPPTPPDPVFADLPVAGAEGFFYFNLGLIHEAFGQISEARRSYLIALRFGANEPDVYVTAGERLVGSLWRYGQRDAADRMLVELMRRAPGPRQAAQLNLVRSKLTEGVVPEGVSGP